MQAGRGSGVASTSSWSASSGRMAVVASSSSNNRSPPLAAAALVVRRSCRRRLAPLVAALPPSRRSTSAAASGIPPLPQRARVTRSAVSGASNEWDDRGSEEQQQQPSTSWSSSPPASSNSNNRKGAFLRRLLASVAVILGGIAVSMAAPRAAAAAGKRTPPAEVSTSSSSLQDVDIAALTADLRTGEAGEVPRPAPSVPESVADPLGFSRSWRAAGVEPKDEDVSASEDEFESIEEEKEKLEAALRNSPESPIVRLRNMKKREKGRRKGGGGGGGGGEAEGAQGAAAAAGRRSRKGAATQRDDADDLPDEARNVGLMPWQVVPQELRGSIVPDPADFAAADPGEPESGFGVPSSPRVPGERRQAPGTAGPPEDFRALSYTQLWSLVREGHVKAVEFSPSGGDVRVELRASAPGGARAVRVGLPYDPAFLDHLVFNGVKVEARRAGLFEYGVWVLIRAAAPFAFLSFATKQLWRFGTRTARKKQKDANRVKKLKAGEAGADFSDVAGIDTVKDEIMELVEFLKNPGKYLRLGARSPAGVLLVGAPGTGKTLLARAVAGEAGVPFFSTSGSDFLETVVGMGANRVRAIFEAARASSPCILFIDEFDGIGQARGTSAGGEDAVQTINQLLTEMDGFDDNTGVIVMAATNRPAALDSALTRPGRFDRMVVVPLPDVQGRADILAVHCRNKRVERGVDLHRIARSTAGFTGAMLCNVTEMAALVAVRRGATAIAEADIYQALEDSFYKRGNKDHDARDGGAEAGGDAGGKGGEGAGDDDGTRVPASLARAICVYEAGRALVGSMLPEYEELAKVVACPDGAPTGFAHFVPKEEHLETGIMTRGYCESLMVSRLAGRAAERLALGDGGITTAGGGDLLAATTVARELLLRAGLSRAVGPLSAMDMEQSYGRRRGTARSVGRFGSATASAASAEIEALLRAAEAKAAYGIARNWAAFAALVAALRERGELTGAEVRSLMVDHGAVPFSDPFCDGFGWDEEGELVWPGKKGEGGEGGEGGGGPALPDAYVARLQPRKKGRVEAPAAGDGKGSSTNPFYPPQKVGGMPEFGERPAVFRFEDIPSQ